jgi:hypothetical protein
MILSAKISPNCKSVIITPDTTGTFTLLYDNHITGTSYLSDSISTTGGVDFEVLSDDIGEVLNGVITIEVAETDEVVQLVGHCEIDCCVAGLLQKVINCDCECDKCDEDLHTAQKIRLLVESAKYAAYSTANLTDAVNKYKKAKEFCDAECSCGC